MFTITDLSPEFVVGIFPALIVGLLTRTHLAGWIKAVLNLLISAIAGAVVLLQTSAGELGPGKFIIAVFVTWITSIVVHFGFWKPSGVSASLQAIPIGLSGSIDRQQDENSDN